MWVAVLPLTPVVSGSHPALKVVVPSKQDQNIPGENWSCWISPAACACSPHLHFACSCGPLLSLPFLWELLPAAVSCCAGVRQWSREGAELAFYVSCICRLGKKWSSPVLYCQAGKSYWGRTSLRLASDCVFFWWLQQRASQGALQLCDASLPLQRKPGRAFGLLQAHSWEELLDSSVWHPVRANVLGIACRLKSLTFQRCLHAPEQHLSAPLSDHQHVICLRWAYVSSTSACPKLPGAR